MDLVKKLREAYDLNKNGQSEFAEKKIKKILLHAPRNPDALRIMGEIFFDRHQYSNAIPYFEKSLEIYDKQPKVLNDCGVCYLYYNRINEAKFFFKKALNFMPDFESALFNQALILEKEGNLKEAIKLHREIIDKNYNQIDSFHKLTSLYFSTQSYKLAYENLVHFGLKHPSMCDAVYYQERSLALINLKEIDEALNDIEKSIKLNPNLSETYNNRGNIFNDLGKDENALNDFKKAIFLNPNSADAYCNLANLYKKLGKYSDALDCYNKSILLDPNNRNFFKNRSIFYREKKQFNLALEDARKCLSLEESDDSYKLLSDVYTSMGDYSSAIKNISVAIKLNPLKKSYYNERGLLFASKGMFAKAKNDYSKKMNINDELSDIQKFNLGILDLTLGEFESGWKNYSSRKMRNEFISMNFSSNKPHWNGQHASGTVYIYNEQGIGDQILFSSLLPEVLKTKNKIILSIDPRMVDIYRRSFNEIDVKEKEVMISGEFINQSLYDFHLAICDLGSLYRNHISDFDFQPISFLKSDINKKLFFSKEIRTKKKITCGISWFSKGLVSEFKSMTLNDILPILSIDEIQFVNLQYGNVEEEINLLKENEKISIHCINNLDLFYDIEGLFSLVDACDFVITTSNVTAHIAGSLGKKTYLLSPYGNGKIWYWVLHNGKNLWYPTIEIIEQKNPSNWKESIAELAKIIESKYL
jgi:tetratricopeptide (TPR) repeat protein